MLVENKLVVKLIIVRTEQLRAMRQMVFGVRTHRAMIEECLAVRVR